MAPNHRQTSSSSDKSDPRYATMDDRKRKRMISNRELARRSRQRKQKQLEDLMAETSRLQIENNAITQRINAASQNYIALESANNILRAQEIELSDRLKSLTSILKIVQQEEDDVSRGASMKINHWQLPCPLPPIMASSDMFQF
ncbi:bZIP transcription factor 53-like [Rutidosis leptorrhynchoides]|uniref:bZIP transcription factor 53-like n=1 Tax=Rutidosis leptorrhynchoides TaxID=125765 RepID=UPI003A9995C2